MGCTTGWEVRACSRRSHVPNSLHPQPRAQYEEHVKVTDGVAEGAKYGASIISPGINLYSSPDLGTWTFEGEILNGNQIKGVPFPAPYRIERPKARARPPARHRRGWACHCRAAGSQHRCD